MAIRWARSTCAALSLARTALDTGGAYATPLVRTMLLTRLARAQAGLGRREDCQHTLDRVHTAFDEPRQSEPQWVSYVDAVEVAAQEGACFLDLGMTEQASRSLSGAITLLTRQTPHRLRDRVHYLSRLARCHLLAGDIELACQHGSDALVLTESLGSARVTERLDEFHKALQPYAKVPAARDFRDRFHAATGR